MKNKLLTLLLILFSTLCFAQGQQILYSTINRQGVQDSIIFNYSSNADTISTQEKMLMGGFIKADPYTQNRSDLYAYSNCETPPTNGNQALQQFYLNGMLHREIKAAYNLNNQIERYIIYNITPSPSPADSIYMNDYVYDINGNVTEENYYEGYPFILRDTKKNFYVNNLLDSTHHHIGNPSPDDYYTKYYYSGTQLTSLFMEYIGPNASYTMLTTFSYNMNNKIIRDSTFYFINNTHSITEYIRNADDKIVYVINSQLIPNDTVATYTYNSFGNIMQVNNINGNETINYYYKTINTSVNDVSEMTDLNLYPNPTCTVSTLSFTSKTNSPYQIEWIDITGKRIGSILESGFIGRHSVQIPTSNLTKGIYFVNVKNDHKTFFTRKLVK
jgi:hypothetical protein